MELFELASAKLIKTKNYTDNTSYKFNVENISSGLYVMRVYDKNNNGVVTRKLIIQ